MAITEQTSFTHCRIGSFASGYRHPPQPRFRPDDSPEGLFRRLRLAINKGDRSQVERLLELLLPPPTPQPD